MRLEVFIAELLFHHDCVVLPGFGGLVANYKPAVLNPHSHIVSPPAKQVGFNRHLKNNDGLLAGHVAAQLGLEYRQAQQLVEQEIEKFKSTLISDGRVSLKNIGLFYNDKSGILHFMPDDQENFLLASYGLKSVQLKPVEQQILSEPVIAPAIADNSRKMHYGWKVAAAIAVPLMIAASLLVTNKLKHSDEFNFASLNPFEKKRVVSAYLPLSDSQGETEIKTELPAVTPWPDSTNKGVVKYNFLNDSIEEKGISVQIQEKQTTAAKVEKNSASSVSSGNRGYAVIGGAFSVKENAQKFLEALKNEGFDARFAGTKDGLQLVAYGIYDTKSEADNALRNIRSSDNRSAWIRRN